MLREQQRIVSYGNALHMLLALDHCKRINVSVDDAAVSQITKNSLLSKEEIKRIAAQVK